MARLQPKKPSSPKGIKPSSSFLLQTPKGMHDILPEDQARWDLLRGAARSIAGAYNFLRIDTSLFEFAEVFERSIGEFTDIVEKEMFMFKTKGHDRLVLRPELTAGIVRAYFQHNLSRLGHPLKLYCEGPVFRYEQPQAGRYRQFHQVGFEILGGEDDPLYDAQIIIATVRFLEELNIRGVSASVNSIGCKTCRPSYRKKLQDYYKTEQSKMCKDCKHRFTVNPLRLLDCKEESCLPLKTNAPVPLDHLCASCRHHFKGVLEYLDDVALPYTLDHRLVRGLDYYNRTVFEVFMSGSPLALGAGGRYDYLGEILGARKTALPAVGSALGLERVHDVLKERDLQNGKSARHERRGSVFLIQIGEPAKRKALSLIEEFRKARIHVLESLGRESLKSQLRVADKEQVGLALILGQREVFEGSIIIRDMQHGTQETVPLHKVVEEVKRKLK